VLGEDISQNYKVNEETHHLQPRKNRPIGSGCITYRNILVGGGRTEVSPGKTWY